MDNLKQAMREWLASLPPDMQDDGTIGRSKIRSALLRPDYAPHLERGCRRCFNRWATAHAPHVFPYSSSVRHRDWIGALREVMAEG